MAIDRVVRLMPCPFIVLRCLANDLTFSVSLYPVCTSEINVGGGGGGGNYALD